MIRIWAVVVAQLVEWLLPIPEVRSSNPVIGNNLFIYWTFVYCQLSIEKMKIKKKEAGNGPIFKTMIRTWGLCDLSRTVAWTLTKHSRPWRLKDKQRSRWKKFFSEVSRWGHALSKSCFDCCSCQIQIKDNPIRLLHQQTTTLETTIQYKQAQHHNYLELWPIL